MLASTLLLAWTYMFSPKPFSKDISHMLLHVQQQEFLPAAETFITTNTTLRTKKS